MEERSEKRKANTLWKHKLVPPKLLRFSLIPLPISCPGLLRNPARDRTKRSLQANDIEVINWPVCV